MGDEARTSRPVGHTVIAIGKLVKVVVLLVVGTMALAMVGKDPPEVLTHWADALRVDAGNHHVHRLIEKVAGVSTKKLEAVGFGTFVYAALFAVEGIGLWMQKRWAEIFTIVITVSFIPVEIYELAHHASAGKVITLVLNVAAVIYLVVRVRHRKHGHDEQDGRAGSLRPSGATS